MTDKRPQRALSGPERHKLARSRRLTQKTRWERLKLWFKGWWWWWTGNILSTKLEAEGSEVRTEAQAALDYVVFETNIPPDCASAMIVRGMPTISLRHDPIFSGATQTVTLGETYLNAAERTVAWIREQGNALTFDGSTKMSRKDQKVFDAKRRKVATQVRLAKTNKKGHH